MRIAQKSEKALKTSEKPARGVRVWWIERRKRWGVEWREQDARPGKTGRLRRVMTTRSTKTEALAKAAQIESDRQKFGTLRAQGLDDRSLRELEQLREALAGAPLSLMLEVWARHKGEVLGGERGLSLGVAAERALAELAEQLKNHRLSQARHDHVELALKRFVGDIGAKRELMTLDEAAIREWLEGIKKDKGWAPVTMLHLTKNIKGFFARATERKWLAQNPAERIPLPFVPKTKIHTLTAEQMETLMRVNRDEPVSLFLALELWGFLRFSSTQRLEREWIKPKERALDLPDFDVETMRRLHKSDRRHYLQGHTKNLWAWVAHWWDDPRPWAMSASQVMHAKSAAFARAKVPHPKNVLRHTAASMSVALHGDAKLTARLMQHTDQDELHEFYLGRATKADAARWARITPDS